MRWIKKKHVEGEIRERYEFLFFPKTIVNRNLDRETRWLEKARWEEHFLGYGDSGREYWVDDDWTN